MDTDPKVISELRRMFREGATPSRLVQHIVERVSHDGSRHPRSLIMHYFGEAFANVLIRLPFREDYSTDDLQYSHLNQRLLHEMVGRRSEWDQENTDGPEYWLDDLDARDCAEHNAAAEVEAIDELSGCVGSLDDAARKYIQRISGNTNWLYEQTRILARLAERLQQRINELEQAAGHAYDTPKENVA